MAKRSFTTSSSRRLLIETYQSSNAPFACQFAAAHESATVNRKDYGISWNKALDQGALLVGNDVEITVNLEASTQAPMATSK